MQKCPGDPVVRPIVKGSKVISGHGVRVRVGSDLSPDLVLLSSGST